MSNSGDGVRALGRFGALDRAWGICLLFSMESILAMARCTWIRLSSGAVCPLGREAKSRGVPCSSRYPAWQLEKIDCNVPLHGVSLDHGALHLDQAQQRGYLPVWSGAESRGSPSPSRYPTYLPSIPSTTYLEMEASNCFLSPIVQGAVVLVHCFEGALSRMTTQGSVQLHRSVTSDT